MVERPLRCGSETSSLQHTQAFICSAGEGLAGASGGRLFTHSIKRQPTVGMRKSAQASLLPSSVAVDSVALGPACTPAAGGRSRIERRPRGHMKESFKDSSLRTIEGRLPFLYVPSCFLLVFGVFFFPSGLVFGGISCQQCPLYRCVCLFAEFISSCECQEAELQACAVL